MPNCVARNIDKGALVMVFGTRKLRILGEARRRR